VTAASEKAAVLVTLKDVPAALSRLAERFFGEPSRRMRLMGVTGTNGKTTTAHLLEAIAQANGERAGFIGTTAVRVAGDERPATHTTPPADAICALLAEMVKANVTTCGMEVSSHALEQKRAEALTFAGAIFTNLTQDHLDYHQTMDAYFAAKARFFTELLPKGAPAVLNADDARVSTLKGISFSATGGKADVRATKVASDDAGTTFTMVSPWGNLDIRTPLFGSYNVANVLGAASLHLACGTPASSVVNGVAGLLRVPGRLERVSHPRGARVLVDYAHTDDALARALDAVRPNVAPGSRLFVVFGCGGDRDAGKRPRMGEAAARRADVVVVTSDNPRSEKPEAIASAIMEGVARVGLGSVDSALRGKGVHVELDRARAIGLAVTAAGPGDVVLLAGKGHETEQIFADRKIPFDDREVAVNAMRGVAP
jgi:UDP-N-acetylmuramoyl-L-alanyl-D-glutamate--2,6-diaminopimelate ligase